MEEKMPNDQRLKQELRLNKEKQASNYRRGSYFWTTFLIVLIFLSGVFLGKKIGPEKVEVSEVKEEKEIKSGLLNFFDDLGRDPKDLFKGDPEDKKPKDVSFDIFWEAWKEMDKKFVDKEKLDSQERVYGAVKGMVEASGDPHSVFLNPEEAKYFNSGINGSFEGIGAELGIKDEILTVIAPIDGMPAKKAGIRAGDKIIKIDGELSSDFTIDEAVKKIRGKKGTEVVLTVIHDGGEDGVEDITIVRGKIEITSIEYENKGGGIGYIRIKRFSEDTDKEFNKALVNAIADGSKGLIIDVRSNPGGLLDVTLKILSNFIPRGEVAVRGRDRNNKEELYRVYNGVEEQMEVPIVVLIDEGSASSSEIVAGALRDLKGSLLVGKKTFGKGSIQTVHDFRDGSMMKITIEKWFTPSGHSIDGVGLEPDVEVEVTKEDFEQEKDPQLDRAIKEIKKQL